ncbi:hypothetical protein DRP04_09210 [Archaeoglobales archaeon]|nr:MAG: hypothetical protein DRP04_09210 [Archaeoglobales archaeon]
MIDLRGVVGMKYDKSVNKKLMKFIKIYNDYQILKIISENNNCDWKKLKELTGLTDPALARHIKILDVEGYIITRVNPKDRRKHYYLITDKGKKLLEELSKFESIFEKIISILEKVELDDKIHI